MHTRVLLLSVAAVIALAPGCAPTSGGLPPPPATPEQNLGPSEPPVIWVAGTLDDVAPDSLRITEPAGSEVKLRRLAGTATAFYRVSGDAWQKLGSKENIATGQDVCVETLADGSTLLALRVFLGSGCGPI
jgi:hypothetical protein